jgi:hypothetical protein
MDLSAPLVLAVFFFTGIITTILSGIAFILPSRLEVPVGYVGIVKVLGKPRFEDIYPTGDPCLLDAGKHWVIPKLMGVLRVKVQEQSVVLEKAIGKVKIDDETKANNEGFKNSTFVDISFGEIRANLVISDPFAFAIHTGGEKFEEELESTLGEAIRDYATTVDTNSVYDANVNIGILEKVRNSKFTNPDTTEEYNVDRWGVFLVSINIPKINPDSDDVKTALEGGYKEILDRIKEKAETLTLLEIFRSLQEEDPNADTAFLWSVAMRLVKDLTKPGRDIFVQSQGGKGAGSSDSILLGVAGQVLNQNNQNNQNN